MALTLPAKAAGDAVRYEWSPQLATGDVISAYTLTPTTVTVSADDHDGSTVTFLVSGGTNGNTYTIAASVVTAEGETLTDTLYIPVRATSVALGYTGQDIATYALSKVAGIGTSPDADELDDALERLTDMLASWAGQGADLGVALPVTTSTTLYISDAHAMAVKCNLRVLCHEHYGIPLSSLDYEQARRGVQQVKTALLSADREAGVYY